MGFVDKVKQQAAVATAVAKDTAQKGQAKIDEVQAKMAADGVLRQLGLEILFERTGRGTPESEERIQGLIESLKDYEVELGAFSPPNSEDKAGN